MTNARAKARTLLFTGNGKGKTTAALGMALRAAGHGMRTAIIQFIKSRPIMGEIAALRHLPGVEIILVGRGFLPDKDSREFDEHRRAAEEGLRRAEEIIASGDRNLVVLDEIANAVFKGLLEERSVVEVVEKASPGTIVVMTGRYAPAGLLAIADTVTDMQSIKHGFQAGWKTQPGVEY
ncbi:MAG: cob(I)yrinic acid a,c-diamide adenosyltransferase [Syntrophaceae bacterium]